MKRTTLYLLVTAAGALLSLPNLTSAGVLTLDDNSPTFTPPENFSDNTIVADTVINGGLIHLTGNATVTSNAGNTSTIMVSGTYSAVAGEIFSVAFKFAADLNTGSPVDFTLSGQIEIAGVTVPLETSGTITPGLHVYEGTLQQPTPFPTDASGDFSGTLTLEFPPTANQPLAAIPGSLDLTVQQIDLKLDPSPATVSAPSQPQNISTRANVGTGDNVLIGGIIITGNDNKEIVLRAIGPSLSGGGVTNALADPMLELFDSTGAMIASNDNWMDLSADDQMILTDHSLAPTGDLESALVSNLAPGAYTAIVTGVGGTTGIALVEAYDIDGGTTDSEFGNISTRGFVGTDEDVMIGGFILGGGEGGFAQVIVRGIGPSLADANVSDVLADPTIEVFDGNGNTIATNDNWMDDPNMQQVSDFGLAPSDPNESALYDVLPIGAYTVILSGVGGTSGNALVEAYDVDPAPTGTKR